MSDCGGEGGVGGDYGGSDFHYSHDDVNTSHDHSFHSHSHTHNDRHHSSSTSNALPTYEDAVGTDGHHHRASSHKGTNHDRQSSSANDMAYEDNGSRNNKDKIRNDDYRQHPQQEISNHTSFDVYDRDQSIFDPPSRTADRRNQAKKSAWAALKARKSAGPEQRSTQMSRCTICLMISFVLIVIAIVLAWTFLKW